jgi:hypothetical protein
MGDLARRRPGERFEVIHESLKQERLHRAHLLIAHAFDLLDDVGPIKDGIVYPLAGCESTQQCRLLFAPDDDVAFVAVVHTSPLLLAQSA